MLHRRIERLEEEKQKADIGLVIIYDPREGIPPVGHHPARNVVYLPDNGREEKSSHVETN